MPPKRGRARTVGLLGIKLLGSSDDEDYRPPGGSGSSSGRAQAAPKRQRRHQRQAAAEEDVPLAQRRRNLLAAARSPQGAGGRAATASGSRGTAGAAAAVAAGAAPADAPAGPAVHLPEEVLCLILRAACAPTAGGAIPTAAAAMCVSRAWRAAVQACPDLWAHIDLARGRRCRPSDAALARAAPRWHRLRSLSLAGVAGVGDAGLQTLAEHCPCLEALSLAHCTQFSDGGLTAELTRMLLRPAAPDGSSTPLRRLDLSFTQVSPKMSGLDHVVREVLFTQARNPGGPVLEELIVEGCPLLTHHGLRAIAEASVEAGRPLLGALRVLNLSQSAGARSDFVLFIERLQYSAPALQQLCLNGLCGAWGWSWNATPSSLPEGAAPPAFPELRVCQVAAKSNPDLAGMGTGATTVNDVCLTRLLAQSPRLEELDVSGCERLSPNCLALAVHPAAPLRHALLARSGACCDEAVAFLVDRFGPTLEAVDLSWGGSRISDAAAAALTRCPRLHSVGLAGTAVTTDGVRQLLVAADQHAAAAGHGSSSGGGSSGGIHPSSSTAREPFRLDVGSCRGLERAAAQVCSRGVLALRAGPSPLPSGSASFSMLGIKDVAGAAAMQLKQAVTGAMKGGDVPAAPEEGPQAVGPTAAGESGSASTEGTARDEVPASDHGERLFAGGSDVGPEERASSAGSPYAFQGEKTAAGGLATEAAAGEVPPLQGLEQTFAGGIDDRDDQEEVLRPGNLRTFSDADPAEAARVPQQPSGLEQEFEDSSFKGV